MNISENCALKASLRRNSQALSVKSRGLETNTYARCGIYGTLTSL